MPSVFPLDPEINDTYQGYYWDGEFWKKQGIEITENYLEESSASATYLTQVNASTTYLTQTSASSTYAPLSGALFTGDVTATKLAATSPGGDEGGEINLEKAATNTTLNTGVVIDVNQDRLRIFEQGSPNRGGYLDISKLGNGVGTPISTIDSGSTVKTFSTKLNLTQAVYGSTGYNFYNETYTTNSKVSSKLLITFGVAYEMNTSSDYIALAVSLNGTDEFTFTDGQSSGAAPYNELPFYTFISTNSYSPNTTISNLRVYIKAISGSVVCPRDAATLHNFFLTVQEIAV